MSNMLWNVNLRRLCRPLVVALVALLLVSGLAGCSAGVTATPAEIPTVAALPTTGPNGTAPPPSATSAPAETATEAPSEIPAAPPTDTAAPVPSPTQAAAQSPASTGSVGDYQWKEVGLAGQDVSDLALLPGGSNIVLAAGPSGAWRSSYDYTKWEALNTGLDVKGRTSVAAIGSADVMYASSHTGCASGLPIAAARTTDGGKTWQKIAAPILNIAAANATIAYATTCDGVSKTTDSGATWTKLAGGSVPNYDPQTLATSPDGESVYAAYASEGGTGKVMRSVNGGQKWEDVTPKAGPNDMLQAPSKLVYVTGSVGRPQDGGVYMLSAQGLWFLPLESTDWKLAKNNPAQDSATPPNYRITALYVDTNYSEEYNKPGPVIYTARAGVGSGEEQVGLGVFRSTNGGLTWDSVGKLPDKRPITALVLAPHDATANPGMVETLLAASHNGVLALPMPPPFR